MNLKALTGSFVLGGLIAAGASALWFHSHQDCCVPSAQEPASNVALSTSTPTAPQSGRDVAATDSQEMRNSPNARSTPTEIIARLTRLKVNPNQPQSIRQFLLALEQLRTAGRAALPAIAEFLSRGEDSDFDAALTRAGFRDGRVPTDFSVPPSLRLGLLEVAKNIGGPEAEALLLRELKTTGRGVEVAYLSAVLQQLSPEKYHDAAVIAARDLLAMPLNSRAQNTLDRSDRDYLYGVLASAGDRSQVAQAQSGLLLPNGNLDRGALRYLQQMLGDGVVGIVSEAWQDLRINASQREPLARVALSYVGSNTAAERLYQTAINDTNLSGSARQNLIEDLNETGFPDPKHLTLSDLPLIEKRLALIDQLAPRAMDSTNAAAFAEARKDLLKMRGDVLQLVAKKP